MAEHRPELNSGVWVADGRPGVVVATEDFCEPSITTQIQAGARILRAATAQSIRRCRGLIPEGGQVWATLGPAGTILALREVTEAQTRAYYAARVAELVQAGPDAVLIQSLADLDEALLALDGAREVTELPVGISLVFGSGADQTETVMGQSSEECARRMTDAGAALIGCDCGCVVDDMVLVVRLLRAHTTLPILALPDAGQRELDGDEVVYRELPEDFASKARSLVTAGATVVGGCCGVTPGHVQALVKVLAGRSRQAR